VTKPARRAETPLQESVAQECVMTDGLAREPATRQRELRMFLFLSVVFFPLLAVAIVASYGFAIWIWQIFNGPPGV
jgi:nitrate reductase NapE